MILKYNCKDTVFFRNTRSVLLFKVKSGRAKFFVLRQIERG